MEDFIDFISNIEESEFNILSKEIINKTFEIFKDKQFKGTLEDSVEYCIKKKYLNTAKIILDLEIDIDPDIIISLVNNYDYNIINLFIESGVDLDSILKISITENCLQEENYLELLMRDDFYEKDKSYLVIYAAHFNFTNLLSCLLMNDQKKTLNHSLLHAIMRGNKKSIQLLINNGADLNEYIKNIEDCSVSSLNDSKCSLIQYKRGIFPIVLSVRNKNINIAQMLIDHGCTLNISELDANNYLINIAIYNNDLEMLKFLFINGVKIENINYNSKDIESNKNSSSCTDIYNYSINTKIYSENIERNNIFPIITAIISIIRGVTNENNHKDISIIKYILDNSITDINKNCNKIKNSAFTLLCQPIVYLMMSNIKYFILLELFVKNNGNINEGLMCLCNSTNNYIEDYNLLGSKEIKNKNLKEIVMRMIIKYGASVNYRDSKGFTPLILSVLRKNYDITYTLLELGANINIQDKHGNTALNYILIDFKLYQEPILYYQCFGEYIQNNEISRRYMEFNTVNLYNYLDLLLSYGANQNIKDNIDKSFKDYINDIITLLTNNKYKIDKYNKILSIFEIINDILNEPVTYSIYYKYGINTDVFEKNILPNISQNLICPISKYPLLDPVMASDGHTYNKKDIQQYFEYSDTSPVTYEKLENLNLKPNYIIKNIVAEIVDRNIKEYKENERLEKIINYKPDLIEL